jgi:hypothetical protein
MDWTLFGNPLQDTGYPSEVLDYIWTKYGNKGPLQNPKDFYK